MSLGPKIPTVEIPSPAARCSGPVSPDTNTPARLNTAINAAKPGAAGSTTAPGTRRFNASSSARSRTLTPEEKYIGTPRSNARVATSAQQSTGHSFFGWLVERCATTPPRSASTDSA
jgi:hypothetical protein